MKMVWNKAAPWLSAIVIGCSGAAGAAEMIITSEIPLATNPSPYIQQFIEEVGKRTDGAIQGKYFPASQLYNDRDGLAALGTGAVHMVWPVSSRLEQFDPRVGVASLPFALTTEEMTNPCFAKGFTEMISGYLEPRGMQVLGFLRTADLIFLMKNRDIQKVEDLKGQKVRVIGGQIMLDAMKSVQASPVSMSASEMSAALSQGAIDGAMTSPAGWADVLGSTAKYATLPPGMGLATSAITVDKLWLDSLPEAQRKAIVDTVADISARQWQETVAKDRELIDQMVAKGGHYRVMAPEEVEKLKARFVAAGEGFRNKQAATLAQLEKVRKECIHDGK
ncbi:TRAP transporter substrate-binding protein DctP [Bordetella sp. 15P40C-2]|uniref:TRAP transporter substrate-binding protein DctP n=1 Tax=Bordetella sp. 15P40C-2 TaxID=2572246 RepID=UPI0013281900|nr:TRAP transporter substrate-binding protein DctP [Bordetella sp. 15P40C-2]MVW69927.1 C4-dicarboxylate ABC transporter substrate-binding protein [Bordetella sp. 15P40C-2]